MMDRLDPREALRMPPAAVISEPGGDEGAIVMIAAIDCVELPELDERIYTLAEVWSCRLSAN